MLRACRRVLKPGGQLSFFVIAVADSLSAEQIDRALDAGPEHVAAGDGYPSLVAEAGFGDVEFVDVTPGYRTTLAAWIREWEAEAAGLIRLLGVEEFAERQARRRRAHAALEEGLLNRWLISAKRPPA